MRNLRDWARKQHILHTDLQGHTDRLRSVTPLTFSGNVQTIGGGRQGMHVHVGGTPQTAPTEVMRVKVVEANVATGPVIQLVRIATADSGPTFPVVSLFKMATNDELYVFRPTGGLTGSPMYDGKPVVWRDERVPDTYRFKITTAPSAGSTSVLAKLYDGGSTSGAEIQIKAIQGHGINDIIYAEPVANGTDVSTADWLEVFTPAVSVAQYKVLQITDTQGRIGLDWVRAH